MKKLLLTISFFIFSLFLASPVLAGNKVDLYFFYGQGCPHCAKEEAFLDQLERDLSDITVHRFEVYHNTNNARLLSQLSKDLDINISGVPFLIVGEKNFSGFFSAETTGVKIKTAVEDYIDYGCQDIIGPLVNNFLNKDQQPVSTEEQECKKDELPATINVPILGEINIKNFSLPVLTLVFGAIDGFNPCAMWVLIFLISLLLGMQDKKRMWAIGFTFILVSAFVYFIFLAAWLNLFLFLGYIVWIRIIIGLVAIGCGAYNLYDFYTNKDASCKVTSSEQKKKIMAGFREAMSKKSLWLSLLGVAILAAGINLIELICSAGLPAVYTQVLSLSGIVGWQRYAYLVLYIILYMLDDMLIFFLAMKTLEIKVIGSKFTRYSHFIGGFIILIIGLLLIFKPELLMFG